jgi:hypothetical protein
MANNPGNYGLSLFGLDPYGSEWAPYGVAGATSYSPHFVQVRFTDLIDLSDPSYLIPSNYVITPTLTVTAVIIESADSVILQTSAQSLEVYTVTVGEATSFFGVPMVPPLNVATFTGYPSVPGYFSAATTPFRVRCIFSTPMLLNAALTSPSSYTVTDLNFGNFPVLTAEPEQTGNPLSVVLTLSIPMETDNWYQTILSPAIVDVNGQSPKPSAVDFQFILPATTTSVSIPEFTGEVSGGPFGHPDGLVFFSPSLNVAAANSIIQVEEVDVCSKAYDSYHIPQPIDPAPFYLWSPNGPKTFLEKEQGFVLFAGFPRLSEARFELDFPELRDRVPLSVDTSVCITMRAQYQPGYVPFLNDPAWWHFDGTHTSTPPMWINANITAVFTVTAVTNHGGQIEITTSAPNEFASGETVNVFNVKESFPVTGHVTAGSSVAATASVHHFATASIVGHALLEPEPARNLNQNHSARASIQSESFFLPPFQTAAAIQAGSSLMATAATDWVHDGVSAIAAGSSVSATASLHCGAHSGISAGASLSDFSPQDPNGTWTIRVVDTTHFILEGSSFVYPYISGGSVSGPNPPPAPPESATQIIVLYVNLGGFATMTVAQPSLVHWALAHIHADSSFATSPEVQPTAIKANSYMRVTRPSLHLGATAAIVGDSSLTLPVFPSHQNWEVTADIVGYAVVDAHCEQAWLATAELLGSSSIFTRAAKNSPVSATLVAGSSVSAHATAGPHAAATLVAGSSVSAHDVVDRMVSGALGGHSTFSASAIVVHPAHSAIIAGSSVHGAVEAHRGAIGTIVAGSSVVAGAHKGPTATAAIVGGSGVVAPAVVHHFASASISGGSSVAASAT